MRIVHIALAAVIMLFGASVHAINMNFLKDSPITRLSAEELKEFTAFVVTTLDAAPDGATVEWKAPKSVFTGKLTSLRTFTDGKLPCREARIETEARDRHASGNYVFCKVKGVWQLKVPDQK